jgi:Cytochrome c7 and related cytochrome c
MLLIGAFWGGVKGWNALAGIGIQQEYAPEQPIRFSHKLHAGQNGISCVYCHSGAEKSRHANIPSVSVCMNCHKYVQEGPQYGKEEIKKIYAALDYDPATQQYGNNPKPVKWIRVHNLPDLAYFNHSQHVKVGGIECQTCHGPVEEMEVVKQQSPLTMGWCINCHRTTEVKMDGNAYYTELHDKLKKQYGPGAKITVDKIGGLECARCHY